MKKIALNNILCFISSLIFAQTVSLTGKLRTSHNSTDSVTIKIKEISTSTTIDETGEYQISL